MSMNILSEQKLELMKDYDKYCYGYIRVLHEHEIGPHRTTHISCTYDMVNMTRPSEGYYRTYKVWITGANGGYMAFSTRQRAFEFYKEYGKMV